MSAKLFKFLHQDLLVLSLYCCDFQWLLICFVHHQFCSLRYFFLSLKRNSGSSTKKWHCNCPSQQKPLLVANNNSCLACRQKLNLIVCGFINKNFSITKHLFMFIFLLDSGLMKKVAFILIILLLLSCVSKLEKMLSNQCSFEQFTNWMTSMIHYLL